MWGTYGWRASFASLRLLAPLQTGTPHASVVLMFVSILIYPLIISSADC
jgi:hypothetical protein